MIALLVGSVVLYFVAVIDNPNAFLDYAALRHTALDHVWFVRYGVVPSMMVGAVAILGLTAIYRRSSRPWLRMAIVAIVAAGLLAGVAPQATRRTDGPSWSAGVTAAAELCERRPAPGSVSITETLGWRVVLPCKLLPGG
jgi:hypothetical protein